ncbi:hypothetical protein Taro_005887 [Colocasia esculenta]|uniref:Uncharacterized protein n=1 Tax=Colocasia esculenta TaxID=4460 RepID=A0A843TUG2_COLES|nr:hypothetical protein [Colocasia esculenta]
MSRATKGYHLHPLNPRVIKGILEDLRNFSKCIQTMVSSRCDCIQEKHQDTSAKYQEKHFKWSCVDIQEVPCRQIDHPEQNKLLEAQMEQ